MVINIACQLSNYLDCQSLVTTERGRWWSTIQRWLIPSNSSQRRWFTGNRRHWSRIQSLKTRIRRALNVVFDKIENADSNQPASVTSSVRDGKSHYFKNPRVIKGDPEPQEHLGASAGRLVRTVPHHRLMLRSIREGNLMGDCQRRQGWYWYWADNAGRPQHQLCNSNTGQW